MKRSIVALAVLAALLIPGLCQAAPPHPGPYVSGFLGVTSPRDTDVTTDLFPGVVQDRVEFDPGIYLGGTGGYDFGMVRLEGELSYKFSEIKRVNEVGGDTFRNIDGDVGALAMMFNAFFDLHNQSPVTPYFGGGIGFAAIHLSDTFGTSTTTGNRVPLYSEDDDTVFAYQAGAGLEIALNPRLSLDLGYRYFGTSEAQFEDNPSQITRFKLQSHNGTVGVRVKF